MNFYTVLKTPAVNHLYFVITVLNTVKHYSKIINDKEQLISINQLSE